MLDSSTADKRHPDINDSDHQPSASMAGDAELILKGNDPFTSGKYWRIGWSIPPITVTVWIISWYYFPSLLERWRNLSCASLVTVSACLVAAYTDLRWRRIFNWITVPSALTCLLLCGVGNFGWAANWNLTAIPFTDSLLGFVGILSLLLVVFSISGGGAGDAKLAAVLGAGLGLAGGLKALAFTFILAGVCGFCWMIWNVGPIKVLSMLGRSIGHLLLPISVTKPGKDELSQLRQPMPLAPFFAAGTILFAFLESFGSWLVEF